MKSSLIISLSGASGVGKGTVARFVLELLPDVSLIRSYTTRKRKDSDMPGEYEYVDDEVFEKMVRSGKFAWHEEAHGNKYGTRIQDILDVALNNKIGIIIITPQTVVKLGVYTWQFSIRLVPIYVYCRDKAILRQRLLARENDVAVVDRRISDCMEWDYQAEMIGGLIWIDNGGELQSTKKLVAQKLKELGIVSTD